MADAGAKKKITVLDMSKYMDKQVRVKFMGGREVVGVLKGYDALLNLVLDETQGRASPRAEQGREQSLMRAALALHADPTPTAPAEYLKAPDDPYKLLDETRALGLTVCRGTSVMLVCPTNGFEEISNPFLEAEEGA